MTCHSTCDDIITTSLDDAIVTSLDDVIATSLDDIIATLSDIRHVALSSCNTWYNSDSTLVNT